MLRRGWIDLNGWLLVILFSVIFTAQVLGFLGLFRWWAAIPMTILLAGTFGQVYFRAGADFLERRTHDSEVEDVPGVHWLLIAAILATIIVLFGMAFSFRQIAWVSSDLALGQDFRAYHGLKVLTLLENGSFWDLSIPFGQYPNGYESLLAFTMLFGASLTWVGVVHAIFTLGLFVALYLLIVRHAVVPRPVAAILAVAIFYVPFVYSQTLLIGKNDLLIAYALLVGLYHAPFGRSADRSQHFLGLAFATGIAFATKANALPIFAALWFAALWVREEADRTKQQHSTHWFPWWHFVAGAGLQVGAGLWVIRNLVDFGALASPDVAAAFNSSIIANLTNPALYTSGTQSAVFLMIAGLVLIAILWMLYEPQIDWQYPSLLLVIAIAFSIMPFSAFINVDVFEMTVQWRYVLFGLFLACIIAVVILRPILLQVTHFFSETIVRAGIGAVILLGTMSGVLFFLDAQTWFNVSGVDALTVFAPETVTNVEENVYRTVAATAEDAVIYTQQTDGFYLVLLDPSLDVIEGVPYPLGLEREQPTPDFALLPNGADFASFADLSWSLVEASEAGDFYERVDQ